MEERDLLTQMFIKKFESFTYDEKNAVYRYMEKIEDLKELSKRGDIPKDELEQQIDLAQLQKDELMLLLLLYNKIMRENKDNKDAS